jgi:hypothetical protein
MQKNFLIKKCSNATRKTANKHLSTRSDQPLDISTHSSSSTRSCLREIERKVREIWEVVASMSLDISEEAILKYMRKTMERKSFRYVEQIMEWCRSHRSIRMPAKAEEIAFEQLLYEMEKLKNEVGEFLWRKFCKDVDIMEEKIHMEDEIIRNSLELAEYQTLTGSFRPFLISNPADLIEEFQSIGGHPTHRSCSRLQQMRYEKLAQSERAVSNLHNWVCESKQGVRISNP